jgi:hypothetical protein
MFADYDHQLVHVNAACPSPQADRPLVIENNLDARRVATAAGADALKRPIPRASTGPLPSRTSEYGDGFVSLARMRSTSSSYPSEGMRSPELVASPPTTLGRRVYDNLTRLAKAPQRFSFWQSTNSEAHANPVRPEITVQTEIRVELAERTSADEVRCTNCAQAYRSDNPPPECGLSLSPKAPDVASRKGSRHPSWLTGRPLQASKSSITLRPDDLGTSEESGRRKSASHSSVSASRASLTCLHRQSGAYDGRDSSDHDNPPEKPLTVSSSQLPHHRSSPSICRVVSRDTDSFRGRLRKAKLEILGNRRRSTYLSDTDLAAERGGDVKRAISESNVGTKGRNLGKKRRLKAEAERSRRRIKAGLRAASEALDSGLEYIRHLFRPVRRETSSGESLSGSIR